MVGATYGAVPLYRLFCQATGFGGTVRSGATVEEKLALRRRARAGDRKARAEAAEGSSEEAPRPASRPAPREITVTFNADVADGLPWRFSPAQRAVVVRPGQSALAFFTARNLGERPVTGVSTYNVAPQQAGAHFNKVQCFCFEEQRLLPGEAVDMPVLFYVDPAIEDDQRLDGVDTLTLSYTFFLVDDGATDPATVAARRAAVEAAREADEEEVRQAAAAAA